MRLIAIVGSHGWIRPCPLACIPPVLVSESFVFYDWPSHNLLWTFALQEKAKSFTVVLNVTCYWIWQRYDSAACSSSSKTLHLWSVSSVQSYHRDRYVRLCFAISVFFTYDVAIFGTGMSSMYNTIFSNMDIYTTRCTTPASKNSYVRRSYFLRQVCLLCTTRFS